ncbi:MAG: hypothetical protein ILO34_08910, partial [Kiritimatiellae bacterium]|nr:hypothetical protein [Kiritimatiellia bacterium]
LSDKSKSLYCSLYRVYGKNRDQSHRLAKTTVEPIVEKIHKSGGEVTDGTRLAALAPTFADVFAVAKHRLEKSHWTMSIISRYKWRI